MHFVTTSENVRQNPKPFLESFFLTDFENDNKTILHRQITEKIAFKKTINKKHISIPSLEGEGRGVR